MTKTHEDWVAHVAAHTAAAQVRWWDGTNEEVRDLERQLCGAVVPPSTKHHLLFTSAKDEREVGPNNTFITRAVATKRLWPLFKNVMRGKVMYAVPYALGPYDAPNVELGVHVTDNPFLVLAFSRMVRTGHAAAERLRSQDDFVRSLHSQGIGAAESGLACAFLESRTLWAVGVSEHTFLQQRGHALRLASCRRDIVAARMAILGLTTPSGERHYIGGVFPDDASRVEFAAPKTRLAGWRTETFSTDVAWLREGSDGRMWAINPEAGALGSSGAHVTPLRELSGASESLENPTGVPLSAIIIGVQRPDTLPLVVETTAWEQACYAGATLLSERSPNGPILSDPMAMREHCGCDLSDYLAEWLRLGRACHAPPKVFVVNRSRRGPDGSLLWRGETLRVVKWMIDRVRGSAPARPTVAGFVPTVDALDWGEDETEATEATRSELLDVRPLEWREELDRREKVLVELGRGVPFELRREHVTLANRVEEMIRRTEPAAT